MTRLLAGTAVLGALLALAAPASAKQSFFFDCPSDMQARIGAKSTSWSPTAPTGSYQSGTGCVTFDPGFLINDPKWDLYLGGTYAGEVKGFDLTLYTQTQGHPINGTLLTKQIQLTVTVDGEEFLPETTFVASTEAGNTQQGYKHTFAVRDLDLPETTTPRAFALQVNSGYSDDFTPWIWGNAEFPSGITFLDHIDLPPVEEEEF